ncbi:MAG: hypothetical protein U9P49_00700, partial [Thermodesulfobacteriota bacterium]|nr:hypothetical protein [Thermodesulfobacteriota bacterium]
FGLPSLDKGHRRSPLPPAMITICRAIIYPPDSFKYIQKLYINHIRSPPVSQSALIISATAMKTGTNTQSV